MRESEPADAVSGESSLAFTVEVSADVTRVALFKEGRVESVDEQDVTGAGTVVFSVLVPRDKSGTYRYYAVAYHGYEVLWQTESVEVKVDASEVEKDAPADGPHVYELKAADEVGAPSTGSEVAGDEGLGSADDSGVPSGGEPGPGMEPEVQDLVEIGDFSFDFELTAKDPKVTSSGQELIFSGRVAVTGDETRWVEFAEGRDWQIELIWQEGDTSLQTLTVANDGVMDVEFSFSPMTFSRNDNDDFSGRGTPTMPF